MEILLNEKQTLRPLVLVQGETGATTLAFSLPRHSAGCNLAALRWQLRATNTQTLGFMVAGLEAQESTDERFLLPWTVTSPFTVAPGPLRVTLCGTQGENTVAKFLLDGINVAENAESTALPNSDPNYFELALLRLEENAASVASAASAAETARQSTQECHVAAIEAAESALQCALTAQTAAENAVQARIAAEEAVSQMRPGGGDMLKSAYASGPKSEEGYVDKATLADSASTAPWASIAGKPSTLAGYGIADAPTANLTTATQAEAETGTATALRGWTPQRVRQAANAAYNAVKDAFVALATPTGSIKMYAGETAPTGFLLCNGQAVSRTEYAALFAVCGVLYGSGNGSTTFNVPDMRNRFPMGAGTLGGNGGEAAHRLTESELPAISPAIKYNTSNPVTLVAGSRTPGYTLNFDAGASAANDITVPLGGNATHENTPPYVALHFIIKT